MSSEPPAKVNVFIKIIDDARIEFRYLSLCLEDKLSNIRKELGKNNTINNILSFSIKSPENEFAEIPREDEQTRCLKGIVEEVNGDNGVSYNLYLKKSSRLGWKFLNDNCKLDHGCTMSFDGIERADKRAFKMKNCKLEIFTNGGYGKG